MEIFNESDISLIINDSVCRVCLSSTKENECIFTFHMTSENRDSTGLLEELQLFGGIEVKHGDGLPSRMCDKCIAKVRIARDFRRQCQESDRKLRSLIEKARNENYENISHDDKRRFAKNQEKQSGGLGEFDEGRAQILSESIDNSARTARYRARLCKNSIVLRNIGEKNAPKEADILRAQSPATSTESDASNFEETWEISTKKLEPDEKNEKTQPKSAEENSASYRRSRRSIVFARLTSMENLKKRKEQQRRHLKKTTRAKNSSNNDESRETIGNGRTSARSTPFYECTKCCRSYKTKRELDQHQFSHKPDRFSCDRCDERFGKLEEFVEHAKTHVTKDKLRPATCEICKRYFRKGFSMVRHLHVHKRENPRAVFAILKNMRDRKKTGELRTESVVERKTSDNVSGSKGKYTKESAESLKDADFPRKIRSYGDKFFNSSKTLGNDSEFPSDDISAIKLINIWIREELDNDNDFPCHICNKSYVTEQWLIKHVSKIHDENGDKTTEHIHERDKNFKRFLCHVCSKTFRKSSGLTFHMRGHTGDKPHICKYCGRGFTASSNRVNHERTHTGDRPYVCHFCSATFAKSCTLKAHLTTHTGEANYHCKTCGKSFKRLKYLKEHRFTHTGEKPYACKICGTAYSHSGSLFVHEKKCKAQFDKARGSKNNSADDENSEIDNPI